MEARIMYRIKFENGEYTPWSFDKKGTIEAIEVLGGKLETKTYNPNFKGLK